MLTGNIKIKIHGTVIYPVVLFGVKIDLSSSGKNRDRRFKNRVLRKTFQTKWDDIKEGWGKNCILWSFMICRPQCVTE